MYIIKIPIDIATVLKYVIVVASIVIFIFLG